MMNKVIHGDCLEVLKGMADNSVDSIVTDPPYGLAFMGKKWDYDVPSEDIWRECLRVLKPGGHLLAFAGTRTQHRMAVRIEDAGFEIRDMIAWVYGSGFPKSLNISKMIDKMAGAEREAVGIKTFADGTKQRSTSRAGIYSEQKGQAVETAPATEAAKQWEGWGSALKPALEPITVARKPFKGTLAENVLEWGTGGINVDGCRVEANWENDPSMRGVGYGFTNDGFTGDGGVVKFHDQSKEWRPIQGRWPANIILDGSDEVVGMFPETKSGALNAGHKRGEGVSSWKGGGGVVQCEYGNDSGSAARFFYQSKASRAERNAGLEGFEEKRADERTETGMGTFVEKGVAKQSNFHPTVKPIALMRYLVRLVTPPNGIVLDPFGGSGSTACGAVMEGMRFVTIEREAEYIPIIEARVAHWTAEAEAEAKEKNKADNQLSLF